MENEHMKRKEMKWMGSDDHVVERQKTKLLTGIGCFFGIAILGFFVIFASVRIYHLIYPGETQLKISHSPNNINTIEIVRIEDFPDPTLRINYDDKSIIKTKLPNKISVEWQNDYEANVILTTQGEPNVVKVEFKN